MRKRNTPNQHFCDSGFTLVELALAIAILGVSLTALLTIHTRSTQSYFRQRDITRAALYAQFLMARVESNPETPEVGSSEGKLADALQDAGFFGEDDSDTAEKTNIDDWQYSKSITSVGLFICEDIFRDIMITVRWGEDVGQSYDLHYLISTKKPCNPQST